MIAAPRFPAAIIRGDSLSLSLSLWRSPGGAAAGRWGGCSKGEWGMWGGT